MTEGLERRAAEMAASGDWVELYVLLASADRPLILASRTLAYRYGEALYHTGRMEELGSFAAEFAAEARRSADSGALMRALNLSGIAAFELGRIEAAERDFEALMEVATAASNRDMLARAANNIGAISNLRGQPDAALAHYKLAEPLYEKLGQARGLAQTRYNIGISYRDLGRLDEAMASYRRASALAADIGYRPLVVMSRIARAEIEHRRGDSPLSRELAERGVAEADELGDPIQRAEALRVRGLTARIVEGEGYPSALNDLRQARQLARETGNVLLQAEVERDLATTHLGAGDSARARKHFERALDLFRQIGATAEAAAAQEALSSLT